MQAAEPRAVAIFQVEDLVVSGCRGQVAAPTAPDSGKTCFWELHNSASEQYVCDEAVLGFSHNAQGFFLSTVLYPTHASDLGLYYRSIPEPSWFYRTVLEAHCLVYRAWCQGWFSELASA